MNLETIARVVEAALNGYGCYHYEKMGPGVFSIRFDDYHAISNVEDMVKIINKDLAVFEVFHDGAYCPALMSKKKADKIFPKWRTQVPSSVDLGWG